MSTPNDATKIHWLELELAAQRKRNTELLLALQALRAAFHVNMLRAFPDKSHDEIAAGIDKILADTPAATSAGEAPISVELLNFLHGSGEIDGVAFGERHPTRRGLYWWRKLLPSADSPTAKGAGGQG